MFELRPYQREAIDALYKYWADGRGENPLIVAPTGCHEAGHPILMHDGTVKRVEDIEVGDDVMGPDSLPRRVQKLHRGSDEMYLVTPTKGEPFSVNSGHVFSLYRTPKKAGKNGYAEITAGDFFRASKRFRNIHKLQRCFVDFPANAPSIPPWVWGALLGRDGSTRVGARFLAAEVASGIAEWASALGYKVHKSRYRGGWICQIISPHAKTPIGVIGLLKEIGAYNTDAKSGKIPQEYKTGSKYQRLELIAGILDSGGYQAGSGYNWISSSETLARDLAFVCRSVGLAAYVSQCKKTLRKHTSAYWRVSISGDCSIIPCRVKHKKAPERDQRKRVAVTGFSLTATGIGEYYGFELDGDHLYLDGYFVRHHNSGKTAIIAQIVRDAMSFAGTRVIILAHVKELLIQGAQGLARLCPEADFGFYSSGIGSKNHERSVTFAGIQSIWQKAYDIVPTPDLVIIDEAHMLPRDTTTRYGKFIADLKICNPQIKVIGLTATPYRLDSGFLHEGDGAIFDGIAYDISILRLMQQGYLSPVVSRGGLQSIDLSAVKKVGGEFNQSDLASAASDPDLVKSTVSEIVTLGAERKSWLIFGSGITHAEMLAAEFDTHGISCAIVAGDDNAKKRDATIARFKNGGLRCLINVNVLTTGFDAPNVDLVALVRATLSPGLYVQMVGRGTRLSAGKRDCLILDYGKNVERHGFIDAVQPTKKPGSGNGDAPVKKCQNCQFLLPAATRICPECSHEFPLPEFNHGTKSHNGAILSTQAQAQWIDVDYVNYGLHKKKDKPDSIRVIYQCGPEDISEWLCPDHGGYAASRYISRKAALGATALTTEEAMVECHNWHWPSRIKARRNGKFYEIVQLDYTQRERTQTEPRGEAWSNRGGYLDDEIPF